MPTPSGHARRAARSILLGTALSAVLAGPALADDIVSRTSGPNGLPFPAFLVDASTSGRYVLLRTGADRFDPPAQVPEADPATLAPFVIRDRTALTTTPVTFVLPGTTTPFAATPIQVSGDGNRVLFDSTDPALLTALGTNGSVFAVLERSTGRILRLPTVPGAVTGNVFLSEDGTRAVLEAETTPNGAPAIYRGPLGGTGSVVLELPGLHLWSASDDVSTIVYGRELLAVDDPNGVNGGYPYAGQVLGVKQGDGAPHVIDESTQEQSISPYGAPGTCSVYQENHSVQSGAVSADGGRIAWNSLETDTGHQGLLTSTVSVRHGSGEVTAQTVSQYATYGVGPLGASHDVFVPYTYAHASGLQLKKAFADGDRTLITSQHAGSGPGGIRYVTEAPYDLTGAASSTPTITFTGTEPVDTAARTSAATWAACPPVIDPVGAFTDYASVRTQKPYSTARSLGLVTYGFQPSGKRPASRLTAKLTVFGFTLWSRTLSAGGTLELPKPLWGLPQVLRVTVYPNAPKAGEPTPAPLSQGYAVQTTRTN